MDAGGGEDGGPMTFAQAEQFFTSLEGPTAQERIDYIFPFLISLLPRPFVPAPEVAGDDSDDERFSLTSSDSEASGAGADADPAAFHPAAVGDGEDHISHLPDALLSNIVSRLTTQEAARTAVLSTRWGGVWAATPLLVDDAHFVGTDRHSDIPVMRAVSRCDILRCASLERLYLGVWHFPKISAARPSVFLKLRELGLFHCVVRDKDLDALLAHCPKLEIFSIVMSYGAPSLLRIVSPSLRVAVDWQSTLDEVSAEDAPCLERMIFQTIDTRRSIKIVSAPRLEVLGFLNLNLHKLEIGGIAIRAGMNVRARAMVPSLKILAVTLQFACNQEAKMLPTLLKCFPHLEKLHVLAIPYKPLNSAHGLEFWESLDSCECLQLHLNTLIVHGCLVQTNEIGFLQYMIREGKALKAVGLCPSPNNKVAMDLVLASFVQSKEASFVESKGASRGGSSSDVILAKMDGSRIFQNAIDMSLDDPFSADNIPLSSSDNIPLSCF
uniref:F-box domain n=1 Tax=Saccharum hybrid cultivar SP80-3280 TaxID=193079 RepID=A0A2R4QNQ5_9POAL|nr:F-box domain [Saccharum hybrid cultivar SP80-3280]